MDVPQPPGAAPVSDPEPVEAWIDRLGRNILTAFTSGGEARPAPQYPADFPGWRSDPIAFEAREAEAIAERLAALEAAAIAEVTGAA